MNVTPEIKTMASAVFAANKSRTFQTFKTIKIQMGWVLHPTMEGGGGNWHAFWEQTQDRR